MLIKVLLYRRTNLKYAIVHYKHTCCDPDVYGRWLRLLKPKGEDKTSIRIVTNKQQQRQRVSHAAVAKEECQGDEARPHLLCLCGTTAYQQFAAWQLLWLSDQHCILKLLTLLPSMLLCHRPRVCSACSCAWFLRPRLRILATNGERRVHCGYFSALYVASARAGVAPAVRCTKARGQQQEGADADGDHTPRHAADHRTSIDQHLTCCLANGGTDASSNDLVCSQVKRTKLSQLPAACDHKLVDFALKPKMGRVL